MRLQLVVRLQLELTRAWRPQALLKENKQLRAGVEKLERENRDLKRSVYELTLKSGSPAPPEPPMAYTDALPLLPLALQARLGALDQRRPRGRALPHERAAGDAARARGRRRRRRVRAAGQGRRLRRRRLRALPEVGAALARGRRLHGQVLAQRPPARLGRARLQGPALGRHHQVQPAAARLTRAARAARH